MLRRILLQSIGLSIVMTLTVVTIGHFTRPRAIGPLTTEFVCRWDMDARGFRSFIQYKDPRGVVVFESEAAGRCEP